MLLKVAIRECICKRLLVDFGQSLEKCQYQLNKLLAIILTLKTDDILLVKLIVLFIDNDSQAAYQSKM